MPKAKTTETTEALIARANAEFALTSEGQQVKHFELAQRWGQALAASPIAPKAYQGNVASSIIASDIALRMNIPPLMAAQNLYVVNGKPAWSSSFLIACVGASGQFTPLDYEWKGKENTDDWSCRAYAYAKGSSKPLYGSWISIKMAKAEGWYGKPGSKWVTMPGQMLLYRAAAFWQRVYAPGISMGFMTKEEAEDILPPEDQYQPSGNVQFETPASVVENAMKAAAPQDDLPEDDEDNVFKNLEN